MMFLSGVVGLLDSRAGFMMSAVVVSWIAIALLVLVVANLSSRLRRVEALVGRTDVRPGAQYGHLIGRRLGDVLETGSAMSPRILILLSNSCSSCSRLLNDMRREAWPESAAIAWIDRTPSPPPYVPSNVMIIDDGPRIARDLGVRLTPFALVADESGRVVNASPLNTLTTLGRAIGSPPTQESSRGFARNTQH